MTSLGEPCQLRKIPPTADPVSWLLVVSDVGVISQPTSTETPAPKYRLHLIMSFLPIVYPAQQLTPKNLGWQIHQSPVSLI